MSGYYIEAAYNVFRSLKKVKTELIPFLRYETYNTHKDVDNSIVTNKNYNNLIITTGLTWRMAKGAVVKADMQFYKSEAQSKYSKMFNAGFGIMF